MDREMMFHAKFTLEDSDVKNGIRLWYKKGHRVFYISTLVLGIMCIFPALVYSLVIIIPQTAIFFYSACAMFLFFHFRGYNFAANTEIAALHNIFETTNNCGEFEISFFEDSFTQSTKAGKKNVMYNDINAVINSDDITIISAMGKKLFFVVNRKVDEDKACELLDFLKEKTNVSEK